MEENDPRRPHQWRWGSNSKARRLPATCVAQCGYLRQAGRLQSLPLCHKRDGGEVSEKIAPARLPFPLLRQTHQ